MTEPMYVIWSYEHDGWWMPNGHGYTQDLRKAGHYPESMAKGLLEMANSREHTNEAMVLISSIVPFVNVYRRAA